MCTHLKSPGAQKEAWELKWKAWLVMFNDGACVRSVICEQTASALQARDAVPGKHVNASQKQLVPQAFIKII